MNEIVVLLIPYLTTKRCNSTTLYSFSKNLRKIHRNLSLITHQKYRSNRAARLKVIRPFMQQCKQCARRIYVS